MKKTKAKLPIQLELPLPPCNPFKFHDTVFCLKNSLWKKGTKGTFTQWDYNTGRVVIRIENEGHFNFLVKELHLWFYK